MKRLTSLILILLVSLMAHDIFANPTTTSDAKSIQTNTDETETSLVDPTRPNWFGINKSKQTSGKLALNSLVMSPQRRIAVINGELMREGDTKLGITLDSILHDRVLIRTKNGKKRVLKLDKSSLRVSKKTFDRTPNLAKRTEGTTR